MKKLGLQLYTVRDFLNSDEEIKALYEQIRSIGYSEIELFGTIENMETPSRIAKEIGLEISGTISNFKAYKDRERMVEFCKRFGIENLGFSASEFNNEDEIERFISEANDLAEYLDQYGIVISYHNHSHEFRKYGSEKTAYEMMAEGFDKRIGFVLDTYWVQHGGGDIRYWIERLKGRLTTLHMKDMKREGNNVVTYAAVGEGNLWWDGIIEASTRAGVKHFVVEQDECDRDPLECAGESAAFLKEYINQ